MAVLCLSGLDADMYRLDPNIACQKVAGADVYARLSRALGFLTETWLQAHYVAVATGILYLILLNGLRWMRVRLRHSAVWLKLLRGTLAAVMVMFLVRLMVVPMNTLPSNWASQHRRYTGL